MKILNKLLFCFFAFASCLGAMEIDSLEGLQEGQEYIQAISVGDTAARRRSDFEKLVEGDSVATEISDSIPVEDEDKFLSLFRQRIDVEIGSFLDKDKARNAVPLFLYKENNHYYSPSPLRQDVQVDEFYISPFLLRKYQLYQDYRPFFSENLREGALYFTQENYDMPILLTKAELAQGYNSTDLDQAILNIYKSQVFGCLDFHLGFNGSSGKWLSEEVREKTKDLFGEIRYYYKDYLSLEYSYLHLDHDLPNEKLFFQKIGQTPKADSLLDNSLITYKSQQHFVVFRSIIFDAGYSYSYSEFLGDSLLNIDQHYDAESYFYALDLDFWEQNLAVGRKYYNNYKSTKIDDRLYYKGKLHSNWWHGSTLRGYYDKTNTSVDFSQGLPWGFELFCDYTDRENQAIDTAFIPFSDVMYRQVDKYKSTFYGLKFNNKFLSGSASFGNLKQTISEHTVLTDTHLVSSSQYANNLLRSDMKVRLPFSLWGQKMALSYGLEMRRFLSGEIPCSFPKSQMLESYELIFYFDYGNVLTLGRREYSASDYFANFSDLDAKSFTTSDKLLDYYLQLDLTKQFSLLLDVKNYDKDETFLGAPVYRRHFKMNFVWYLFD